MTQSAARIQRVTLPIRASSPAWVLAAVWGAVDVTWCGVTGFRLAGIDSAAIAGALLLTICATYRSRSRVVADLTGSLGLWVAVALVAISTTDLAIRTAAPLADTALITADRALGFDWSVWTARIDAHPAARLFLAVVYVSILPQLLGSFVYFAFIGRVRRSRELAVITLVALIPTAAALLVAPALGPFVDFGMPDRAVYLASLQSLRAGALVHTVGPGDGMVCFPSFHTVWALALIYVHRGNGWITAVIATLNAVLIISVLSEGGHYLVDLLAGIVVAMAAISVTRWTMREPRRITA